MNLVLRWLASALALILVSYLPFLGIAVSSFWTALVAALVIGLLNALLGSVLKLITFPLNVLSLGLVYLIINAFLFWLATLWVSGFDATGGAIATFFAALIYGFLAAFIAGVFGAEKK